MRTPTVLLWSVSALSIAAMMAASQFVPARAADSAAPATGTNWANTPAGGPVKIKRSVPEDGMGVQDIPASSRLVRDILAARPHEDLVICIAGCNEGIDRVIYAQPADLEAKKPPVAEQTPGDTNVPTAEAKPETPAPAGPAQAAAPAAAPDQDASSTPPAAGGEAKMEPTAAEPPAVEATPEPAPAEAAPEPEQSGGNDGDNQPAPEPDASSGDNNNDSN